MSPTASPSIPAPPSGQAVTPAPILWADPAREVAFQAWLAATATAHGLDAGIVRAASADASFRRYFRVDRADGTGHRIIMDAPPDKENCQPFVQVAGLLQAAGLRVPEILAWDEPQGFMLLSDLGAQTMLDVLDRDRPQANLGLYQQAVDILVDWQRASRPGVLPAYDEALLQRELALFPEWYVQRHRGITLDDQQQATLQATFQTLVAHNLAAPSVYVHRDFMPRNLMVSYAAPTLPAARGSLPPEGVRSALGRPGGGTDVRLGVLDFQDAVYGPITYDIASLMRDAFLSWEEDFVLDITVRYWQAARKAGLPVHEDFGDFYRAVEWMGLQRHLKVAGIFARITLRDGKPKYLADTPRFIHYIRTTASRYRELAPLLRLLDQIEGTTPQVGFAYGRV